MLRLFLLDGMALAYRAYFAFINNPLRNSKGQNTSAVFGFTNTLIKILDEEKPDYVAVAFDTPQPTFRHKAYASYKATREKMPEDMSPQLPLLKQITEAMGVPVIEAPGYEADDIMGTLAVRAVGEQLETYLVTGDKDFMQLVTAGVTMYNPMKKGVDKEILDVAGVESKTGLKPSQITDLLGLMGDTADNIPGVKGVGEKTALKLIHEFGSIENLYARIDSVKGKIKENLLNDRDNALLSKSLATIQVDVPLEIDIHSLRRAEMDRDRLHGLLYDLEFNSFIQKLLGETTTEQISTRPSPTVSSVIYVGPDNDMSACMKEISAAKTLALEFELSHEEPMKAELTGMVFSTDSGQTYVIPCPSDALEYRLELLRPILETPAIAKTGHNIKRAAIWLCRRGITLAGTDFDTVIAGHLLNSERSTTLPTLAQQYLGQELPNEEPDSTRVVDQGAADVVARRTRAIFDLRTVMSPLLESTGSGRVFRDIEIPLIEVLTALETNGVWLNLDILAGMSKDFGNKISEVEQVIFKEAGVRFNLNSPQQLGELLFDRLQIHKLAGVEKPRRTGKTGQYATDVKILDLYRGLPIVDAILTYRQLTKLKSTYIDGLPPLLNPVTQRIHSTFSQTVAATGRLSSSNPNFQNIPIRTDMGREIRRAVAPQLPGWLLLSADYSQIELRVMAHMSGDETLIEAFHQNADIHTSTAMRVFGLAEEQVTKDLRRKAKDINFGIMYGISPFGLASRIGMTQSEAKDFIAGYFSKFPKVKELIDRIIAEGRENGYVTTLFGRRRYLTDLQSKNYTVRQMAERAATNAPIQGTAAELIKVAMIGIYRAIRKSHLKARMILQVHDELVFEVPENESDVLKAIVVDHMENAASLRVPLTVDVGIGNNWFELK